MNLQYFLTNIQNMSFEEFLNSFRGKVMCRIVILEEDGERYDNYLQDNFVPKYLRIMKMKSITAREYDILINVTEEKEKTETKINSKVVIMQENNGSYNKEIYNNNLDHSETFQQFKDMTISSIYASDNDLIIEVNKNN